MREEKENLKGIFVEFGLISVFLLFSFAITFVSFATHKLDGLLVLPLLVGIFFYSLSLISDDDEPL